MPTLAGLASSVVAGEFTTEQAAAALRAAGIDESELGVLLVELDQAMGRPSDEQFAAAYLAYTVSDLVADRRTAVVLVAAWARLLMYDGSIDEAGRVAREAESRGRDVADMRLRAMVASLRASMAMLAGDDDAIEARRRSVRMAGEIGDARLLTVEEIALGNQLGGDEVGHDEAGRYLRAAVDRARQEGLHDSEAQALLILARQAERRGEQTAAADLLDAAAAALASTGESYELLQVVGAIVNMRYRLGSAHRFVDLLRLGERLARTFGEVDLQIRYMNNLGLTQAAAGDARDAARLLREAHTLAVQTGDREAAAQIERDLAGVDTSDTTTATPPTGSDTAVAQVIALADEVMAGRLNINEAIERAPASTDPDAMVDDLLDVAEDAAEERDQWAFAVTTIVLFSAGEHVSARTRYRLLMLWGLFSTHAFKPDDALWAFDQAARIGVGLDEPKLVVVALTNAGTVLRRVGKPVDAAAVYDRAVVLAAGCEPEVLAAAAVNAGTAHGGLRRYVHARDLYETALAVYERDPAANGPQLATALLNHGETLSRLGNPAAAERQLLRALRLQREHAMTSQEGVTIGLLGQLRLDRGNLAAGLGHLERALEIAEAQPDSWNAALWALDLASLCTASGMVGPAAWYYHDLLRAHPGRRARSRTQPLLGGSTGGGDLTGPAGYQRRVGPRLQRGPVTIQPLVAIGDHPPGLGRAHGQVGVT